jgi:hypothetical protein
MGQGVVLSLCDRTAIMVTPWAVAGFECICVDWHHEEIARHTATTVMKAGRRHQGFVVCEAGKA